MDGSPAERLLGLQVAEAAAGRAAVSMQVTAAMANGHGLAHGGLLFLLADAAFARASNSGGRVAVAHSAQIQRTPAPGGYVGNYSRGGRYEYVPLPPELTGALDYLARRVPLPYLCVDFLFDGERYWLSEIEPDGATFPDEHLPEQRQRSIIAARYRAYQRGHARWLAQRTGTPPPARSPRWPSWRRCR